ncbi:Lon protease mitochondrial [Parelaphostrongylus tenuis]|uniref:Lon protease homolog, mitochondrial n=1 Tax=Parelaphostrongylus tenuis TaxID=148309 RepID=A0AAD5REL4_PARTN|nr:Lon protease mitochondrial [Parelaphostrongylus tenuis]
MRMIRASALCIRCALRQSWVRPVSVSSMVIHRQILLFESTSRLGQSRFYSSSSGGEGDTPAATEEAPAVETAIVEGSDMSGMSTINIPDVFPIVPILAINRYPLFPGFIKKVDVVKDDSLKHIIRNRVALKQPYVGVFVKQDDENKEEVVSSLSQLYNVGCFAQIIEMRDHGKILELVLSAHRRIRILEPVEDASSDEPHKTLNGRRAGIRKKGLAVPKPVHQTGDRNVVLLARTENVIAEPAERNNETKAKMQAVVQTIRDVVQYSALFGQQINLLLHPSQNVIENPVYLCDLVATLVQSADTKELQEMMEEISVSRRLDLALVLIQKEKTVAKLKYDINKDVEKKVQDQHRKYLLNEQLKVIKKELGLEKDDKSTIIEKMEERLKDLKVPEYAMKVIKEEQQKLQFLDPHSSEFGVTRNYLDWLTNIPWGITSEENNDLQKARTALDQGHYGMKDVKQRILEFIAVSILKKHVSGKILCLNGPPGTGKTSIAKSIAQALNREYFRFSVGGMTDVAEIKGHRRTYVGAMPGKMIQCLKKVHTENPLVLIDEVDKIGGAGYHGDPASALLELLDPEQNANFNDHFLDVPVDLSRVLFICTANSVDNIPGPLKDRMELIEVSGYLAEEKIEIAQKYLIPQARNETSLTEEQLVIDKSAVEHLIKFYCRESGVRNLQKHIERVFRKAALEIADRSSGNSDAAVPTITVDMENLEKYVGRPKFPSNRMYEKTPPGVTMGLAWTSMGGSALYIEAVLKRPVDFASDKDGSIEITGNLGDVMKESVRAALTVAKGIISRDEPDNRFLDKAHIHLHVPEGATPKDGPSAGVTIVSSLLSLAFNRPVKQDMAMTGEISLTGKVLPVGGIKEKIIAARRVVRNEYFYLKRIVENTMTYQIL